HAEYAGEDEPRVRELEDEAVRAESEEQDRDLRVDHEVQKRLDRILTILNDRRALRCEPYFTRRRGHGPAIDLREKIADIVRLEVDDLHGHGVVGSGADALPNRVLRPLLV